MRFIILLLFNLIFPIYNKTNSAKEPSNIQNLSSNVSSYTPGNIKLEKTSEEEPQKSDKGVYIIPKKNSIPFKNKIPIIYFYLNKKF